MIRDDRRWRFTFGYNDPGISMDSKLGTTHLRRRSELPIFEVSIRSSVPCAPHAPLTRERRRPMVGLSRRRASVVEAELTITNDHYANFSWSGDDIPYVRPEPASNPTYVTPPPM